MVISEITSALSSVKTAIDITKLIINSSQSLEYAELKYKLSEILSSLAEANIEIVTFKGLLEDKENKIAELESKLKLKDEVIKKEDAYYRKTENGFPIGEPFCIRCWEVDHELYHLIENNDDSLNNQCPKCNKKYKIERTNNQTGDCSNY